jgi:hypothetical protein
MALADKDRTAITDLISLHGHLCDRGELGRLDEVFTADVVYDLTDFGQGPLQGLGACIAAARALGEGNPVGHHITNVLLAESAGGQVQARSKGIGIYADGTCGSLIYEDTIVRATQGWRISHRRVSVRRVPLGGK